MGFFDKVKDFFYEDEDDETVDFKPEKRIKPDKIKEEKPKKEKREFFKREVSDKTQNLSVDYDDENPNNMKKKKQILI